MAPGITESPDEVPQYEIQDEHEGDGENVCPEDQVLHHAFAAAHLLHSTLAHVEQAWHA